MATKYDLENLMSDIRTMLQAKMNTKISELNTEKGDSLLSTIDDNAFVIQTQNDSSMNFDPFVIIGVQNITTDSANALGVATGQIFEISIVLIVADDASNDYALKMFRYGRALREVFEENWDSYTQGYRTVVRSVVPVQLTEMNSGHIYHAVGVRVDAAIG